MTHVLVDDLLDISRSAAATSEGYAGSWWPVLLADLVTVVWAGAAAGAPSANGLWPLERADAELVSLAISSHHHDLDDVHYDSLTHPGSVVWPTVLTLAPRLPVSVGEVVRSVAIGYEVTARIGTALLGRTTLHTTCVAGAAGAAAAASALLHLDARTTAHAVAHALSASGGLGECLVEGSGTRAFHRAAAGRTGVAAAAAARAGTTGTRRVLEGDRGLWASISVDGRDRLLASSPPAVGTTRVRPYSVSGFHQAAVLAVATRAWPVGGTIVVEVPEVVVAHSARQPAAGTLEHDVARAVEAAGGTAARVALQVGAGLGLHQVRVGREGDLGLVVTLPAASDPGAAELVRAKGVRLGVVDGRSSLDAALARWAALIDRPDAPATEACAAIIAVLRQTGAPG